MDKYFHQKDKNGNVVSDWAEQVGKGKAKCKFCNVVVSFQSSKKGLFQHSETSKHIKNSNVSDGTQKSVAELFKEKEGSMSDHEVAKEQAQHLEVKLIASMYRHQITPHFFDCLVPILKEALPECDIIQRLALSREKARYVALHGMA